MILDSGETKFLGIGVVFGDCRTDVFPGFWDGSVGYHTDDRRIFVDFFNTENGKRSSLSGKISITHYFPKTYWALTVTLPLNLRWPAKNGDSSPMYTNRVKSCFSRSEWITESLVVKVES